MRPPASYAVADTARHIRRALLDCQRNDAPYRHWTLVDVLPNPLCTGIISLPIAPAVLDNCEGVRDTDNSKRVFITPELQSRFPVLATLATAMQDPSVAARMSTTCGIDVEGSYLRMEYIQDTNGAWLTPHRDIPEKLFSMVLYLFTGPDTAEWGTDIYDADCQWVGQSTGTFNSGIIFVPGADTWHGFEKRTIVGIRRLLEINYVRSDWRDRDQLSFPDRPIALL